MHHSAARSPKVNAKIVDGSVISRFSVKTVQATTVKITIFRLEEIIAFVIANRDTSGKTALH
jgi:hypothetical protein